MGRSKTGKSLVKIGTSKSLLPQSAPTCRALVGLDLPPVVGVGLLVGTEESGNRLATFPAAPTNVESDLVRETNGRSRRKA